MMVFVTGATGLVGSHLLYRLVSTGHTVVALKRPQSELGEVEKVFGQYPRGQELFSGVSWVDGNVLEKDSLEPYVRRAEYVYHCAAVVSFASGDQDLLLNTNLRGSENIASLCTDYQVRLCYVSSIAALGDAAAADEYVDEETLEIPQREHSVYSRSKGMAEKIVRKYIGEGLNVVMVCPSVILGAGMWNRSSARLYRTAAQGIPFYTRGGTGYVDVRDVVELMVRLAEDQAVKGERFVLNGGNYSYRTLFTVIARANGRRPPRWYLRPWMTEVAWRVVQGIGTLTGQKPAFTRETARSSQRTSRYSSAKILARYPDFHFYSLEETIGHIRLVSLGDCGYVN